MRARRKIFWIPRVDEFTYLDENNAVFSGFDGSQQLIPITRGFLWIEFA
jgi:hypothetical protein